MQPSGWVTSSPDKYKPSGTGQSNGWNSGSQSSGWNSGSQSSGWNTGSTSSGWNTGSTSSGWNTGSTSSGWNTERTSNGWGSGTGKNGWGSTNDWKSESWASAATSWTTNTTESKSASSGNSGWTVDKTNTNSDSNSKPKTGNEIFGVVEQNFPTFHFGTGKKFTSYTDSETPFDKYPIKTTQFVLPNPPKPTKSMQKKTFQLSETEIENITGEEDEETKFCEKTKAFALVTEDGKTTYAEIALGDIHVNYHPELKIYRIVLRKDSKNVAINSRVFKEMKPQLKGKTVRILVQCTNSSDKPKFEVCALQFATEEISKRFTDLLNDIISKM